MEMSQRPKDFINNLILATILVLLASKISGQPSVDSQSRFERGSIFEDDGTPSDDELFGNEDDWLSEDFKDMDQNERIHDKIDQGFDLWEDKCRKIGGEQALDDWLKAQEELIHCAMVNFNYLTIQDEIALKMETGELDLVFKKYCGQPVNDTRPCIKNFLEVSRKCVKSEDRDGLNTTMTMVDAAINFMCHNSGDRMALFMAEKGVECLTEHQEQVMSCVDQTDIFSTISSGSGTGSRRRSIDPVITFTEENCQRGYDLRHCLESELLKCDDPTPSNVVNSMLLAMWRATPCSSRTSHYRTSSASSSNISTTAQVSIALATLLFSILRLRIS